MRLKCLMHLYTNGGTGYLIISCINFKNDDGNWQCGFAATNHDPKVRAGTEERGVPTSLGGTSKRKSL